MAATLRAFESRIRELVPGLEGVYTDVHAHPELSMQETRTAGVAADRLRDLGFDVTRGLGKTGVVGLLRNGEGPTVMLRADMDALPVQEATGLPYASVETATDAAGKETGPTSASEDFGCFGAHWHAPSVFWFVGGTDPAICSAAEKARRLSELPTNHNPRFALVLHPTLETGVAALVAASLAWLAP